MPFAIHVQRTKDLKDTAWAIHYQCTIISSICLSHQIFTNISWLSNITADFNYYFLQQFKWFTCTVLYHYIIKIRMQ